MAAKNNGKFLNNNPSLPMDISIDWTPEMLTEFKKCQEDVIYFAENYFYIVHLDRGREKIKLYEPQKRAILKVIENRYTIGCASRQVGKALDIETHIPTPNGWTTMGALKNGDKVFDENGNICTVAKAHDIMYDRPCYKIVFSNGEKIVADEDHLWMTQSFAERRNGRNKESKKTTKEIAETLIANKSSNHRILRPNSVEMPDIKLPIDPYLMGLWLGDGHAHNFIITGNTTDIQNTSNYLLINNILNRDNISIYPIADTNCSRMHIIGKTINNKSFYSIFQANMKENKRIPEEYLRSSKNQRLQLLRGLMDTDGSAGKKCYFYNTDSILVEQVKELLSSLSINFSHTVRENSYKGKQGKLLHALVFSSDKRVFNLERKVTNQKISKSIKTTAVYITDIIKVASRPVRCITVDSPKGMFLCGKTFIPTSNTTLMTVVCLWYTLFYKDFSVAILANKETQAKEILERIKTAYEEIPSWLKSGVKEFTKEQVRFTNDSKIYVSTTSIDAIRGKSVNLLFLDEFAHVRDEIADDFFKAIMPTISSSETSKLVIVSTPKGILNRFYTLFSSAENNEMKRLQKQQQAIDAPEEEEDYEKKEDDFDTDGWAYFRIYWYEIPGRDERWKQKQLILINHDMELWKQEYDIEFLKYGASAINGDIITKLKRMCCAPQLELFEGDYKIWQTPVEGNIYVFGIDTAQGVAQDYSVCHILDITDLKDMRVVAIYASNRLSPTVFAERIFNIIPAWGRPFLCVESNKEGMEFLNAIMETHKYDNIVYYNMENDKRGYYQKPGIFCHQNSKYTGITNMKHWVETAEAVSIYDLTTVKEFETFIRKENKTWAAQKGSRDDRIMALVWALIILEPKIVSRYFDVIDYDDLGMPARIKDPNYELALQAFKSSNRGRNIVESSYNDPTVVLFDMKPTPNLRFANVDVELDGLLAGGWKII